MCAMLMLMAMGIEEYDLCFRCCIDTGGIFVFPIRIYLQDVW